MEHMVKVLSEVKILQVKITLSANCSGEQYARQLLIVHAIIAMWQGL